MAVATRLHEFKYKDFTEKQKVGEGEFGVVYAAKHPQFLKLTVRVISRRFFPRGDEHKVLREEAEELFSIVSEQVIRMLGVVMEPEHLCLVFEYAEFGSLDKVLMRHRMHWPLKIRIAYEIAQGMCFLHDKNILHLRLKCKKILIAGNIHVKISDLCFHGRRGMNTWTRCANAYSQSVGGGLQRSNTIDHVPPELISNVNANPGKAADVYAYGIILWQVITDKTPYKGLDSDAVCAGVVFGTRPQLNLVRDDRPDIIYDLMVKCWSDRKDERPSFKRVLHELEPKFKEIEHEARDLALACQKDIDPFYFPRGTGVQPPHGDANWRHNTHVAPPAEGTRAESADGRAVSINVQDERMEPKLHATPPQQPQAAPGVTVIPVPQPTTPTDQGGRDFITPAENSSRQATTNDLYLVAEHLGKAWRRFGRSLGFSDGQLDNIDMNYSKYGYPEIPHQMLRRWVERNGRVTVGYLVKMLKSVDLSNVAACLEA